MRNLFLTGFMGCGKTTVGVSLADKLEYDFIDTDNIIEQEQKMKIPEIFEVHGETHFRQLEAEKIMELSQNQYAVIATGGGALIEEFNIENARKGGVLIYLQLPFELCYKRIKNSTRPLAANKSYEEIKALYYKRAPIYLANADIVINADRTVHDIINSIIISL